MVNVVSRMSPFQILQAVVLKQLTSVAAGAIVSQVSGLSVVVPQVKGCREK